MSRIFAIAARNLMRYRRRTLLTTALIVLSMVAVLLFVAVSGSFKSLMVGQITDAMLGHLQVHKRGYVASIDNLPLHLNMKPQMVERAEAVLNGIPAIEAISPRVKLGAMFSNFVQTTSIRLNGVVPEQELKVSPLLPKRLLEGDLAGGLVKRGHILIPELLARGMQVKVGDTVVLVATNKDGSVNGKSFVVQGVLEGLSGPGGRDGYIHIDDARELLRMQEPEVSEIAVRLRDPSALPDVMRTLQRTLGALMNKQGKPAFEIHTWEKLTPFSNIANMIDLLTLFIKVMLVAVVLISVLNVMIMAVYERIREIGTIAAIGTPPGRILGLYLTEGLLLGVIGTAVGTVVSLALIYGLNIAQLRFSFGRQENLILSPTIGAADVLTIALMVIAVAVIAGLQPAWKAARMDPITALRQV